MEVTNNAGELAVSLQKEGPFAFPFSVNCVMCPGMTLRDYFAAKAMAGICAHTDTWGLATSQKIASAAYEMADTMLAERAK